MAEKPTGRQKPSTSHLRESNLRQDDTPTTPPKPDEEDEWGSFDPTTSPKKPPAPATAAAAPAATPKLTPPSPAATATASPAAAPPEEEEDEDEEDEDEEDEEDDDEEDDDEEDSKPATTAGAEVSDPMSFVQMWEQMQAQKDQALKAFDDQIALKEGEIKVLEEQLDGLVQKRDQFAKSVGAPTLTDGSDEGATRTRGRRRRGQSADDGSGEQQASRTRRGPRPKNDKTLKEAIKDVLQKLGRVTLKKIAQEVLDSGFKTNSQKFPNTVRVQLYRLDDDGEINIYDDGTFELRKKK